MSYQSFLAHLSEIVSATHKTLDVLNKVAVATAEIAPMFGPKGAQVAAVAGTVGEVTEVLGTVTQ